MQPPKVTLLSLLTLTCMVTLGCESIDEQPTTTPSSDQGEDMHSEDLSAGSNADLGGDARDIGASPDTPRDTPTGEVLHYRDLAYTPPAGVETDQARLDLSRVDDGQVRPLVLLVHGGSWVSGDKSNFESKVAPWWRERGYVAASVNFRLASKPGETPIVKPADQARDIAAALNWLMSHAGEYQIATEGVVMLGHSSGAHLVALLGTDERYLRDAGVSEDQIAAVISLDVHVYDVPFALDLMEGSVVERNIPTIRYLFGETEEEQLSASPINYTDGWAARALVVSVDADPDVEGTHGHIVSKAAERYVAALRAADHRADTIHDITETHESLVLEFGEPGDQTTETIQELLESLP